MHQQGTQSRGNKNQQGQKQGAKSTPKSRGNGKDHSAKGPSQAEMQAGPRKVMAQPGRFAVTPEGDRQLYRNCADNKEQGFFRKDGPWVPLLDDAPVREADDAIGNK